MNVKNGAIKDHATIPRKILYPPSVNAALKSDVKSPKICDTSSSTPKIKLPSEICGMMVISCTGVKRKFGSWHAAILSPKMAIKTMHTNVVTPGIGNCEMLELVMNFSSLSCFPLH